MITSEDRENGRKLFRSAGNLWQSSDDLSALMRSLEEMLSKGKADIGEVEATDKKNKVDKTDWVARASLRNWDVKGETEEGNLPEPLPISCAFAEPRMRQSRPLTGRGWIRPASSWAGTRAKPPIGT